MKIINYCSNYCIGCGLCGSEQKVSFRVDDNGYANPYFQDGDGIEKFLESVCPVTGKNYDFLDGNSIWGEMVNAYVGYSCDNQIRKAASSGGVITTVAIYLLESGKVDAIVQVKADENNPIATKVQISESREQVLECMGSRYSISNPWMNLDEIVEDNKQYAAVGKPCDIAALRTLKKRSSKYSNIKYLLSFFCAGLPSKKANEKLLYELGCPQEQCISLVYRGNGWPGYATAMERDGKSYQMEYSKAWGGILGRDIHPYCRLCIDGIGDAADIACGDGWYIKNGHPDFEEHDGRNIILSRTRVGQSLIEEAASAGYISTERWENLEELKVIQKYQYTRKTTMRAKLLAYRIMGRSVPKYPKKVLAGYARQGDIKEQIKIFIGTLKRIIQGKV